MDLAAVKDVRKRSANQFPHAKLSLRRSFASTMYAPLHMRVLSPGVDSTQWGFAIQCTNG